MNGNLNSSGLRTEELLQLQQQIDRFLSAGRDAVRTLSTERLLALLQDPTAVAPPAARLLKRILRSDAGETVLRLACGEGAESSATDALTALCLDPGAVRTVVACFSRAAEERAAPTVGYEPVREPVRDPAPGPAGPGASSAGMFDSDDLNF